MTNSEQGVAIVCAVKLNSGTFKGGVRDLNDSSALAVCSVNP